MTTAKAKLSAADFLAALQGKRQEYELAGIGVVTIRALTVDEVATFGEVGISGADSMLRAVAWGLVEPALDSEQIAQLHHASAGPILDLSTAIARLSGIATAQNGLEGESGGSS